MKTSHRNNFRLRYKINLNQIVHRYTRLPFRYSDERTIRGPFIVTNGEAASVLFIQIHLLRDHLPPLAKARPPWASFCMPSSPVDFNTMITNYEDHRVLYSSGNETYPIVASFVFLWHGFIFCLCLWIAICPTPSQFFGNVSHTVFRI